MSEEEGILIFLAGFLIIILISLVVALIFHIFMAIGLFKIAKREGKADMAWLAWIPIANAFLMTQLVENDVHESMRGNFTLIYGIAFAGSIVLTWIIPFIGLVASALLVYGFYFICKRYSSNEVLHLVIVIVTCTISMPIQLFIFGNRKPRNVADEIVFPNE